jgi:amino acid permease
MGLCHGRYLVGGGAQLCSDVGERRRSELTGLAVYTLGRRSGIVVSAVYALLIYALLVACIAGLGSVVACWLPPLPQVLVCCLSPGIVMAMLAFAPFKAMDSLNRALCSLMIVAITSLVGIGISAKREKLMMMMMPGSGSSSTSYGTSLTLQAVLSAIPLIVLTLSFHVITPLVCKVVGGKPEEARNAILCGGAIPLAMVLVWNAVILALAPPPQLLPSSKILDPIKLLLSTSSLAAPAVQAFAFSALGTTLIGYALSFPKQLMDTADLFMSSAKSVSGTTNQNVFSLEECWWQDKRRMAALAMALGPSVAVAIICPTAFATALKFAGVYANCFLFGVLPPVLAWKYRHSSHHQSKQVKSTRLVPGGDLMLLFLLLIAISLGFRPSGSTT